MALRSPAAIPAVLLVLLVALTVGCGDGRPDGITDLAADADPNLTLPDTFPREWGPPADATLIDVQEEPDDPTVGPSATWLVDDDHESVVQSVETILTSLRWTVLSSQVDPPGQGAARAYFLVDNGRAYSVTVWTTPNLSGTRLLLELPAQARRDAPTGAGS